MDDEEAPMTEEDDRAESREADADEATAADALDAAAGDLVDTAALARIMGFDELWRGQLRITQAFESAFAHRKLPLEELSGAKAMLGALSSEIERTVARPAEDFLASVRESLLPLASVMDKFIEAVRSHWPRNWPTGDDSLSLEELSRFVEQSRWPIIWVPEPAVVSALVQASQTDRDAVLLGHTAVILSNCSDVLSECAGSVVAELVPYAREAVDAAANGHFRCAQSQAAAVVTTVLEDLMGFPSLASAARDLDFDLEDIAFDRARIGYILSCIPQSLTNFGDRANGAPIPEHFNRHATLHRVCDRQYTPRNALVALMLSTALLREIDELDQGARWASLLG